LYGLRIFVGPLKNKCHMYTAFWLVFLFNLKAHHNW